MPYPLNPRPCTAPDQPADCIPATQFSQYLFLPTTTPPTLPNDWGDDDWKLTSEKTGDPEIDNNPQELFGVKGVSVDLAWQVTTGRPDVLIAVLDSGIEWQNPQPDLVNKFHLNRGELPVPEGSTQHRRPVRPQRRRRLQHSRLPGRRHAPAGLARLRCRTATG